MSDEAAEFRAALNAAGQPWSRWGVRAVGAGILALLALQLVVVPYAVYALLVAAVVIAIGWTLLIVAVFKRRQWAKAHPVADAALDIGPLGRAP